jgi:hypothetical protein
MAKTPEKKGKKLIKPMTKEIVIRKKSPSYKQVLMVTAHFVVRRGNLKICFFSEEIGVPKNDDTGTIDLVQEVEVVIPLADFDDFLEGIKQVVEQLNKLRESGELGGNEDILYT